MAICIVSHPAFCCFNYYMFSGILYTGGMWPYTTDSASEAESIICCATAMARSIVLLTSGQHVHTIAKFIPKDASHVQFEWFSCTINSCSIIVNDATFWCQYCHTEFVGGLSSLITVNITSLFIATLSLGHFPDRDPATELSSVLQWHQTLPGNCSVSAKLWYPREKRTDIQIPGGGSGR